MSDCKSKTVRLNVGGTNYEVSRNTLERCEGSMLASLISDHWKEGNSDDDKPIFIDRNGLLFQYVLDYLRTNKIHLPSSVSQAAVNEEFAYYGIDDGIRRGDLEFISPYVLEAQEGISEMNQRAAMNAAQKSIKCVKGVYSHQRELFYFLLIEYYKINPPAGRRITINNPYDLLLKDNDWALNEMRNRGFVVLQIKQVENAITIYREPEGV